MHFIFKLIKKIVISSFFIYGFNILAQSINIIIPLNIYTITYTSLFGIGGFFSLIIVLLYGY